MDATINEKSVRCRTCSFSFFIEYNVKIVFLHDQERQTSTQTQLNVFLACGFNQSNCQEKTHPNLSRIVQKAIKVD